MPRNKAYLSLCHEFALLGDHEQEDAAALLLVGVGAIDIVGIPREDLIRIVGGFVDAGGGGTLPSSVSVWLPPLNTSKPSSP